MTKEQQEEKEDIQYLATCPYGNNGESIEDIAKRFEKDGFTVKRDINLKAGYYRIDLIKKDPKTGEKLYETGFSWTGSLLGIAKHKRWKNLKCFPSLTKADERKINKELKEDLDNLSEELTEIIRNTK